MGMKKAWFLAIGAVALLVFFLINRFPYALNSEYSLMNLVYLGILASAIIMGVTSNPEIRWQGQLRYGLIWLAILMTLVVGYSYKDVFLNSRVGAELFPHIAQSGAGGEIQLKRREDGHFYMEIYVNNQPVLFMIDTGASDIVLTPGDAKRTGINPERLVFNKMYSTANGIGRGASVTLGIMQVGGNTFRDVRASVNQAEMDHSLLGMAFLNRFQKVQLEGNRLTLVP